MENITTIIGDYLDGDLAQDQCRELAAWIGQSAQNRRRFVAECAIHSGLQDAFAGAKAMNAEMFEPEQAAVSCPVLVETPFVQPSFCPPLVPSFLAATYRGTVEFFSRETPFAILIATLVFVLAGVVGSMITIEHGVALPGQSSSNVGAGLASNHRTDHESVSPEKVPFVGQITGLVDCRWVDNDSAPIHNRVVLGAKYMLKSGLLEITYHTGARVILQGPCTYEVESTAGGYLSLGKLTARVESRSRLPSGTQPTDLDAAKSRPVGGTYFAVRTPTATVTDLGTEFGVEVGEKGETLSHVFVGKVHVKQIAAEGGQPDREVVLGADESVRVELLGSQSGSSSLKVVHGNLKAREFVRPAQMALKLKEVRERPLQEHLRWREFSDQLRGRDDLVAYYDFQQDDDHPRDANGSEIMRNRAKTGAALDGVLVGAVRLGMARGRWPGKQALEFNNSFDGVRVNIPGRMPSCTLAAWVNVNWMPDDRCGILLSDKYYANRGALHWQVFNDGRMEAAVNDIAMHGVNEGIDWCSDKPVLDVKQPNGWRHFAVVFDKDAKSVVSYMDGQLVKMSPAAVSAVWTPVEIGRATIGSWDCGKRPLGGRIDELMIFNRALNAEEIQSLFNGRRSKAGHSETREIPLDRKEVSSKQ